jgi:DNA invertase Pin-like site-specific DNA recombinase
VRFVYVICNNVQAISFLILVSLVAGKKLASEINLRFYSGLEEALDFCRDGDTFVVTKLDRLARSVIHLAEIVDRLERKKVSLKSLNLNLDTSTPTGKLMINLLGSIAAFEREIMLERQRDGIAAAKKEGKYRGRSPTARSKTPAVLKMISDGLSMTQVAKQLKISRASTYRIRKLANVSHV